MRARVKSIAALPSTNSRAGRVLKLATAHLPEGWRSVEDFVSEERRRNGAAREQVGVERLERELLPIPLLRTLTQLEDELATEDVRARLGRLLGVTLDLG